MPAPLLNLRYPLNTPAAALVWESSLEIPLQVMPAMPVFTFTKTWFSSENFPLGQEDVDAAGSTLKTLPEPTVFTSNVSRTLFLPPTLSLAKEYCTGAPELKRGFCPEIWHALVNVFVASDLTHRSVTALV